MLSLQSETGPSWENKTEKAFWRGRDSRQERLDLVRMSHRHPDVIDARLTHMFFFKHSDDLGEIVKRVSFFDFFKVINLYIFMTCTCRVRSNSCSVYKSVFSLFIKLLKLQFKYQINVDGTVAAYRLPYLLAADSVVFKQESKYYEHFYKDVSLPSSFTAAHCYSCRCYFS